MLTLKQFKELHELVDDIFAESNRLGWSWVMLAQAAGVHISTVYKLGNFDTMFPRANTVMLLAQAVGLKLKAVKAHKKLKLA